MSDPSDLVTITVSREDVETVREYLRVRLIEESPDPDLEDVPDAYAELSWVNYAAFRLFKALPEPEWEPSDAQIDAYISAWSHIGYANWSNARETAVESLQILHRGGFDLSLRAPSLSGED